MYLFFVLALKTKERKVAILELLSEPKILTYKAMGGYKVWESFNAELLVKSV